LHGPRPPSVSRSELLSDGTDLDFRVFLHAFMIFSRRLEAIRSHLAEIIGVSSPQYEILSHLRESASTGGLTVNEAAERLHCSGAFVTTETGKLCRAGLVLRKRDQNDARRVRLMLSPTCERRFREMAPVQLQLNDLLFASLTTRQFRVLREVFPRLAGDGDRAIALAEFQRKSTALLDKNAS
jgi:MarR family transcriptional regulator, organic hydroperoxide resistance regulator